MSWFFEVSAQFNGMQQSGQGGNQPGLKGNSGTENNISQTPNQSVVIKLNQKLHAIHTLMMLNVIQKQDVIMIILQIIAILFKQKGDNCHLSVDKLTCDINDGCNWKNGKCSSLNEPQSCAEIKNEYDCNNSSLNCLYDNSSYKCYDQVIQTPDNKKDRLDYDYSDRDCKTLRKRGHKVYCTYDETAEDDSLYFNIDKVIDIDKKDTKHVVVQCVNQFQLLKV